MPSDKPPRSLSPVNQMRFRQLTLPGRFLVAHGVFDSTVLHPELIPADESFIAIAPHLSLLDAIYVGTALRRPVVFMAAAGLWNIPLVGGLLRDTDQIPVKRGNRASGVKAQAKAMDVLHHGGIHMRFPEGHIPNPVGQLAEFKPGAARLAIEAGVPLLPIGMWGTQHVLPPHQPWYRQRLHRHAPVALSIGQLIQPPSATGLDDEAFKAIVRMFNNVARDAVQALTTEAREYLENRTPAL